MSLDKAEKALDIFQKGYNQQVIFYGPPGTSKTYTSTILAALQLNNGNKDWNSKNLTDYNHAQEYLKSSDVKNRFDLVQFHPSYTYEDFIRGIEVKTNDDSQVTYDVVNKVFGKIADKAQENYKSKDDTLPYVLIIDEINRAPLASVLGELIYGLEYRENAFATPYTMKETNSNQLVVPPNLFIIGTMNTADRSIGAMDYAVRRRFAFLSLLSEPQEIIKTWENSENIDEVITFGKLICSSDISSTSASTEKNSEMDKQANADTSDTEEETAENPSTAGTSEPKYKGLYAEVRALFTQTNMADPSIDPEDIKLGHTYFLCDPDKCKTKKSAYEYMNYRLEYQIKPILKEYVKDGLLNTSVKDAIEKLTFKED